MDQLQSESSISSVNETGMQRFDLDLKAVWRMASRLKY